MKSTATAYLLWAIGGFGVLGLHRFYLGRWPSGLVWLGTGGVLLVGAMVDLFALGEMVRVENLARELLRQAAAPPQPAERGKRLREPFPVLRDE